jgi:hypothetical protein
LQEAMDCIDQLQFQVQNAYTHEQNNMSGQIIGDFTACNPKPAKKLSSLEEESGEFQLQLP